MQQQQHVPMPIANDANFISGWLRYLRQTNLATRREVSQVQVGSATEPILDVDVNVSPTEAAKRRNEINTSVKS